MVLQYDKREECLLREEQMDASLVAKCKAGGPCGLLSLLAGKSFAYDAQTAPYPFETIGKWMNMTNAITKELFDRLTDASSISFILDSNSPHRFNYSSTVNITELLQHPNPSLMARLYVDTTEEVVKLVTLAMHPQFNYRSYPFRFKYPSLHGEFQFAFVMFHLGEDYEVVNGLGHHSVESVAVEESPLSADWSVFPRDESGGPLCGSLLRGLHEDAVFPNLGTGRGLLYALRGRKAIPRH